MTPQSTRTGFVQALAGGASPAEVIRPTRNSRLDAIAAGGAPSLVADACAAPSAAKRLARLGQGYDLVIVDLPSLEGSSETLAIARLLSAIVLVCADRGATRGVAQAALRKLDATGIAILGAVFNRGPRGDGGSLGILSRWTRVAARKRRAA